MSQKKIVICGGGVIGCTAAYFLSKIGGDQVEIIVIEKTEIAAAASGKAGGFLASDWCDNSTDLTYICSASFKVHEELAEELDGATNYEYRKLNTYNMEIEAKIAKEQRSVHPDSCLEASEREWLNGIGIDSSNPKQFERAGTKATTAQLHPHKFSNHLIKLAQSNGNTRVQIGVGVKGLLFEDQNPSKVIGVELEDGTQISDADEVILAVGPWTHYASKWFDSKHQPIATALQQWVNPLKAQSVVLETIKEEHRNKIPASALFLVFSDLELGVKREAEIYPRPSGQVYICGLSDKEKLPENTRDIHASEEMTQILLQAARSVSSFLETTPSDDGNSEARLVVSQACYVPESEDTLPVIGRFRGIPEGLWVSTAHNCWGILNSAASGKATAESILLNSSFIDLAPFAPDRIILSDKSQ